MKILNWSEAVDLTADSSAKQVDLMKQARQQLGLFWVISIEGSKAVVKDLTAESSAEHIGLMKQAR